MAREALVTGATGFIGRHLVDKLIGEGWKVRALVRRTSDTGHLVRSGVFLVTGDLRKPDSLDAAVAGVDTVYHLAAVTAARTEDEYELANASGTRALAEAILRANPPPRRLVYLSSYAAAGPSPANSARRRDTTPAPLTAYGRTKLAGEHAAQIAERGGVEVVVIRAPVVYGPGDRALLPFFRLVRMRLAPAPAGEDRKLHLVYAPDLAIALCAASDVPPGIYPVAEPVAHRWGDIAGSIGRGFKRRPVRIPLPAPLVRMAAASVETLGRLAGRAVPFNSEKAEEMLAPGWVCDLDGSEALLPHPQVTPLEEGIDRTIRWYIRQGWL